MDKILWQLSTSQFSIDSTYFTQTTQLLESQFVYWSC